MRKNCAIAIENIEEKFLSEKERLMGIIQKRIDEIHNLDECESKKRKLGELDDAMYIAEIGLRELTAELENMSVREMSDRLRMFEESLMFCIE